ncbi:hypothetical protein HU200_036786 [Digitaria exilis]|uniref:Uncharacterized protein n=1 Tax=Digitaria exilis TaxID=1010633 RepID=A0A835BKG0_9POAL|nr:hypothetical protein HU200_036786 [Digitaria exilis]
MASTKLVALALLLVSVHLVVSPCTAARHHAAESVSSDSERGTPAVMTVNGFEEGEDGGGPAECDEQYHSDRDMLAALSTPWYAGGRRCNKLIRITSTRTGRSVEARVVDECDSRHGGCKRNIVDTSAAVWEALGLDTDIGEEAVTWSDV